MKALSHKKKLSWIRGQHISFGDQRERCKNVSHDNTTSLCSQKKLNCQENSSTRSKIIKVGTQTNVLYLCARTFAFCFWGCFIEVSFKINNFEISRSGICFKIIVSLFQVGEKKTCFASYLSSIHFSRKPRKTARGITNQVKKNCCAPRLPYI